MTDSKFELILDMVHHTPGESPVDSHFLNPEFLKDAGYNGQVLSSQIQCAVSVNTPDCPQPSAAEAEWTIRHAAKIENQIKQAQDAGLLCLCWTDFVVMPRRIVEALTGEITTQSEQRHEYDIKGAITPDINSKKLQELIRTQIDEIFDRFPALDGLMVRVGETYLHDLPYHIGGDPIIKGTESHLTLISLLREAVCEKYGKLLVYRTWLSGIDEDRQAYLALNDKVPPHPKLIFSIKHCIGDFHRAHPFSPPLGTGRHRQIVEIQCQREYEGKGAYPNWIVDGVLDGFEEYDYIMPPDEPRSLRDIAANPLIAGIWTWSRGGGWNGPYITNEFWPELNARTLTAWTQNPEKSSRDCLTAAAKHYNFSDTDVEALQKICNLSAKAILRGTASLKGGIDTLWTRDCFIGGVENPQTPMARAIRQVVKANRVAEIIAERRQAVELWQQIVELAKLIKSGSVELRAFIVTSAHYGLCCYQVFESGWSLLLLEAAGPESGSFDLNEIKAALQRYDQAWSDWQKLAANNPHCASLYDRNYCRYVRDHGMVPHTGLGDSIERIRQELLTQAN